MPLYDYECRMCSHHFEQVFHLDDIKEEVDCLKCGGRATKIIAPGFYYGNEDAKWIREAAETANRESFKPETREFIKNPTRKTRKDWMRAEGLRIMENNEPVRPPKTDLSNLRKAMIHECIRDRALSVR